MFGKWVICPRPEVMLPHDPQCTLRSVAQHEPTEATTTAAEPGDWMRGPYSAHWWRRCAIAGVLLLIGMSAVAVSARTSADSANTAKPEQSAPEQSAESPQSIFAGRSHPELLPPPTIRMCNSVFASRQQFLETLSESSSTSRHRTPDPIRERCGMPTVGQWLRSSSPPPTGRAGNRQRSAGARPRRPAIRGVLPGTGRPLRRRSGDVRAGSGADPRPIDGAVRSIQLRH